jgi:hypothetical protein
MNMEKERDELVGRIGEELSDVAYKMIGFGENHDGDGPSEEEDELCADALMAAAFMCEPRLDRFVGRARLLLESLKAVKNETPEFATGFDAACSANWSSLKTDKASQFDLEKTASMTLQALVQAIGVRLFDAKRKGSSEYWMAIDHCVEIARDVAYAMSDEVNKEEEYRRSYRNENMHSEG